MVAAIGWFPTTALVIALPTLQSDFGTSVDELGWVPNAYTLAVAATIVAAGRISDRLGRRRFLLAGTLGFTAAMALAAAAPTFPLLLVAVALAGIAGAFMFTASLGMLKVDFSGAAQALVIALYAAATNFGQALGVPVGGLLDDSALGWRSIFWLAVPFGLIAALLVARHARESRAPARAPLDVAGAVSVGAAVVMLVTAGMQGEDWGWLSAGTLLTVAAALVAAGVSVAVLRRAAEPILPLEALGDRTFVTGTATNAVANAAMSGVLFVGALFLEDALGESAAHAGVLLLALTGTVVVFCIVGGRLLRRLSGAPLLSVGAIAIVAGILIAAHTEAATGYGELVPGWVVLGLGVGIVASVALNVALSRVPGETAAASGGTFAAAALLGGTFGVTLASVLFTAFSDNTDPARGDASAIAAGVTGTMYGLAGIAALAVLMSLSLLVAERRGGQGGPSPAR